MRKGKTGTHQTELTVERGSEVRGMLEDVLPSKTMLAVNDITVKATNMSQSKSTGNPSARTYQKYCQLPWEHRCSLFSV